MFLWDRWLSLGLNMRITLNEVSIKQYNLLEVQFHGKLFDICAMQLAVIKSVRGRQTPRRTCGAGQTEGHRLAVIVGVHARAYIYTTDNKCNKYFYCINSCKNNLRYLKVFQSRIFRECQKCTYVKPFFST